jgi:hypothetical protein
MAHRLGERKVENILAAGAQAVFTGNVGCLLQIGKHLRARRPEVWAAHPIDVLWASYSGDYSGLRWTPPVGEASRRGASPNPSTKGR